jgi:hypothetical protein
MIKLIAGAILLMSFLGEGNAGPRVERILKKIGLPYALTPDSLYKVYVDQAGEASVIFLREVELPTVKEKGFDGTLLFVYAVICGTREDAENPPAQLKKIIEINAKLLTGRIDVASDDGAIYYCVSHWLSTANETTVALEIGIAHKLSVDLKKVLCSF